MTLADDTPETKTAKPANAARLDKRLLEFDRNQDELLDGAEIEAFARVVPKDDALQTLVGFLVSMGGATDAMIDRVKAFDANKDGNVGKDELPERLQVLIEKADTDHNGALNLAELQALSTNAGNLELPRDLLIELNGRGVTATAKRILLLDGDKDEKVTRDELIEPLRAMFDRADLNRDGILDVAEIQGLDSTYERTGLPREFNDLDGRNGDRGGTTNLERLLAFDKDKDGSLAKNELLGQRHNLLDRLDGDRDGALNLEELQRWERREALANRVQAGRGTEAPSAFEQSLQERNVSEAQKQAALEIIKEYRASVRKLPVEARAGLLRQIKEALGAQAYPQFQSDVVESLRQRGGGFNGRYIPSKTIVARLLTFDLDQDGLLTKSEVEAMAPRLAQVQRVMDAHHLERRDVVTESSVKRIRGFDANKDGKVDKAELPERLHALLESQDTNHDAILDSAELEILENEENFARFVQGAVGGVNLSLIEQSLKNLKGEANSRQQAVDALEAYQARLRDSAEQARVELQSKLDGALGAKEFQALQDSLAQRSSPRD